MVEVRLLERRLASGIEARVVRLMPKTFRVLPCFSQSAPADETRLALILAEARLGQPVVAVPPAAQRMPAQEVGGSLRIAARSAARSAERAGVACAPLRLLRTVAAGLAPDEVLINANHFLFLPTEVDTPFDAYGDPIGLTLADGVIETPPQLSRTCLLIADSGPQMRRIGFADCPIIAANGQPFAPHPFGPPSQTGPGTAFALFHGSVGGITPTAEGAWEVAYVGRHAVALSKGGGLSIPRAGCVLRCADRAGAEAVAAGPVTYGLPGLHQGVQSGPLIVEGGQCTEIGRDVFAEEIMAATAPRPDTVPVSPHAWAADWHNTRAARLSAGITAAGRVFFCAVEGTSSFFRDGPARGATLHDLAMLMIAEGAVQAMHLDGGGSTQVFCHGGGAPLVA
jgi:hypothetical protein